MTDFDRQPVLQGALLSLRPLQQDDFDALAAAASDPLIWAQHPDPQRYLPGPFKERFFDGAMASGGAFAVVSASGEIIGSTRYYDWKPDTAALAIGYTFLRRDCWGTGMNAEMKALMLEHAFAGADVVWFHVGKANHRSRRAVEKLGARLSHEVLMDVNGVPMPYLHFHLDAARG